MLGVRAGLGGDGAVDPDTTVLQVRLRLVGLLHSQVALCKELGERRWGEREDKSFLWVQENMSSGDRYTMKFLFCDRRPVAEFISGGSRAGKDIGAWVGAAGDKEKREKEEMSGESKLRGWEAR